MAGQIRVSPETLQTGANDYGKASSDVNTILSNLSNLQGQLRSEWEGAAFQGFDAQFNELKPKVTQFAKLTADQHSTYQDCWGYAAAWWSTVS